MIGTCRNCGQASNEHDDEICAMYSGGMLKEKRIGDELSSILSTYSHINLGHALRRAKERVAEYDQQNAERIIRSLENAS